MAALHVMSLDTGISRLRHDAPCPGIYLTYIHTYILTYKNIYTHTYIHTHTYTQFNRNIIKVIEYYK